MFDDKKCPGCGRRISQRDRLCLSCLEFDRLREQLQAASDSLHESRAGVRNQRERAEKAEAEVARLRKAMEWALATCKRYQYNVSDMLLSSPPQNPCAVYVSWTLEDALQGKDKP